MSVITLSAIIFLSLPFQLGLGMADAGSEAAGPTSASDRLPQGLAYTLANALQDKIPRNYHMQQKRGGFFAENPANDLNAAFTKKGVEISDRAGKWHWSMQTTGWGRRGNVSPVRATQPAIAGARVEYSRGPFFKEWYLNSAWGLEQCFMVTDRPPDPTVTLPSALIIDITLSGSLQPDLRNNTLSLRDADGLTVMTYAGLFAFDADGRSLGVSLALIDKNLRIRVDDTGARYPVIIDPWVQRAKLIANGGQADDIFGCAIAIDGDTVVVGASSHTVGTAAEAGAAYVFEKPASGWAATSTYSAKLTASGGAAHERFGNSVAVSGNTVVVGAYLADGRYGAAFVFQKPLTGGWQDTSTAAKLTASDRAYPDEFGNSVAIDGDTVVVGAHYKDTVTGAAYVFTKGGSLFWTSKTETAKLTADDGEDYDYFGHSVAVNGDTVVVGANQDDTMTGAAYVFEKPLIGGWQDTSTAAKLTAGDGANYDYFGQSVAISGDTVVVGADHDGNLQGSVYVFEKPVGAWATTSAHTAKLTASDGIGVSAQFRLVRCHQRGHHRGGGRDTMNPGAWRTGGLPMCTGNPLPAGQPQTMKTAS